MEGGRFLPSRENPRSLGFPSANNKEIPVEMIQKPLTPILDRFKALLKDQEELRVSDDDDDILQPSAEDIVQIYEIVLSELTANSKPIITELTIIAGEQKEYAEGIADAICTRIVEAPSEQKLPSLYLLDSIVKNIGDEYITYFALRLPEVFCEAYRKVQPNQYRAMRHLFRTWSTVFPLSALEMIEAELKFSPVVNNQSSASASLRSDESPSPRPAHGIHVNPKYLEARRQFEQAAAVNMLATDCGSIAACLTSFKGERMERNASATPKGWSGASSQFDEVEDARGISSNLPRYGQKTFEHDQYDIDHAEVSNQVAIRRLRSPSIVTMAGAEKLRVGATELLPSGDGFPNNNSPRRIAEYGPGRANRKEGERNEWWTKHTSDSDHQHVGTYHPYHLSHGSDQERPRALIDAYGNYRGESIPNEKPMKIERLDMNGMKSDTTAKSWQNTEEEEYVWEDMSPTLDRSRSNHLTGLGPPLGNISTRTGSGRPGAVLSETNFRVGSWPRLHQVPAADDSTIIAENGSSHLGSGRGVIGEKPLFGLGVRYEATQRQGSNYSPEPWNSQHHFPTSFQHHRAKAPSFPSSGPVLSVCQRQPSLMDNMDVLSSITPATMAEKQLLQKPCSPPMASHVWPPVNVGKYRPLPPFPILPQHKLMKGQFSLLDANKPLINEGPNDFPQQQFDAVDRNPLDSTNLLQLPHQLGGLTSLNGQSQGQVAPPMPQFLRSQQAEESSVQRILPQAPSHLAGHPFSHGHPLQGHGPYVPPNGLPSVPIHNASNNSFQFQGGQLPPLPPGPPPASLQMGPSSQSMGPLASQPPGGGAFSGLISSLMAQGLISLTKPVPTQDSVGVEFNVDVLKVRHESAIRALYADLPRQCTTCGLRFKGQEEHSAHMDWHVTKNRISRNCKQKPSRNWFVSTSVWLSTAEALGSEAAPGFLSAESVIEKKDDEEMAVPADDNQNACALCGELFDDFYSDETEEWMYRGAVYLNAPDGSTEGIDRSQLGPIVHAKCRSETTVVSTEDFGLQEGGTGEDDSQRKRMRV